MCNVPGEAHDNGGDDGDLHGTDDGGDEDIVQLLATGDHIEDVEVQQLVALGATIGRLAPGGRNTRTHTYKHTHGQGWFTGSYRRCAVYNNKITIYICYIEKNILN